MSLISVLKSYLPSLFTNTNNPPPQNNPNPPINSPSSSSPAPIPSKEQFRTGTTTSHTLTLPSGRTLGYAEYGSPTGKPIIYAHGLPGSRLEAAGFDVPAREVGARIIAVDRPGIGWSSPQPVAERTLLGYARDVEDLVEGLGLQKGFGVLGISGGGPYALACASALPREKLKCVSIVVGLGPPDIGMKGADIIHRLGFPYGLRYAPLSIVRRFWQSQPCGRVDLTDSQRLEMLLKQPLSNEKDRAFMESDWPRLFMAATRESFAQGYEGVWQDGRLVCLDFGFRVEDVRKDLPVQLWYGKQDCFVPLNHGVQIAKRLGHGGVMLREMDETHGSMVVNRAKEILEEMVKSM